MTEKEDAPLNIPPFESYTVLICLRAACISDTRASVESPGFVVCAPPQRQPQRLHLFVERLAAHVPCGRYRVVLAES
jgi:hypothetical protein